MLNRQRAQKYLQKFDFESLFIEELGWDTVDRVMLPFEMDGNSFEVVSIAQKRGFIVYQCLTPEIPARPIRVKLDRQLTDYSKSHLLVFGDEQKTQQIWMWVRQEPGKPLAPRFEQYQMGQSAERLLQKLEALAIAVAEEEKLTLVEVAQRVKKAFDVEKVTKKFFTRFEKEHKQFLQFIDGIQSEFDRTWYASLMLNRLMFIYFIQKKNFLDGDMNYLRNRLKRCQAEWGTDTFHSFYRQFLLRLFHEGLGKPDRNPELDQLLGKIPYLNGGLFEMHQLEEKYEETIQIPDAAFEQVFNFFDEYDWHLDDRPLRNQNEINPDVLGYIFEKYVNQKQMGAYYTKEDITEYISKNTIIPFLFDAAKKRYPAAFKPPHPLTPSPQGEGEQENTLTPLSPPGRGAGGEGLSTAIRPHPLTPSPQGEGEPEAQSPSPLVGEGFRVRGSEGNSGGEGSIWQLLQENPDRYIYPAVRHGVIRQKEEGKRQMDEDDIIPLPAEIAAGINDVSQRGGWNKPAAEGFALPTETWREHVARRKRCLELRQKLAAGEVTQINDLITYNLDIRQFAQDVITSCESSDLLKAFYQAIEQVSVLDPTCGSGAFLFAALNILEPLYTACLERMQGFVDEDDARLSPHPLTPSPKGGEGEQESGSAPLSRSGRGVGGEGNSGEKSNDYWEISPALRQRMTEIAREFRKQPTPSEAILWQALRGRKLDGRKFKRQQPIGAFIVDFFCGAERLVVEVDGGVHETQQEYDQQRQELLELLGLRFVRVSSQQVETDLNGVLEIIRAAFRPHPLTPSPQGEGEPDSSLAPLSPLGRGAGGEGLSIAIRPHPLTPSPQGEGEPDSSLAPLSPLGRGAGGEGLKPRYEYFRKVLAEMAKHPNPRYFVLKSIVLNNLYGVDIMEEATEICKLRLFLKLVAQMEPQPKKENFGLEPLPDIDFNIRAGNTLVGFASLEEVRKAIKQDGAQLKLDLQDDASRINEKAELADRAFQRFRQMQTEFGMDAGDFRTAKKELRRRLAELNEELNHYLAREYGVDVNKPAAFEKWRDSHQPFHWFVEFYSIIDRGGFDVIIGNPPYVEYKNVKNTYTIRDFKTIDCADLYAFTMERSLSLLLKKGWIGMIVPISIVSTDGFDSLRKSLKSQKYISWNLNFAERPSKLFTGVEKRLTIWLTSKINEEGKALSYLEGYKRWLAEERDDLFAQIKFVKHNNSLNLVGTSMPKISSVIEATILTRMSEQKSLVTFLSKKSQNIVYYTRKLRYFVQFYNFIPRIVNVQGEVIEPSELKILSFPSNVLKDIAIAALNSNLFFWFFNSYSDVRNVNRREIEEFRLSMDEVGSELISILSDLVNEVTFQGVRRNEDHSRFFGLN